ncbi:MAG: hypothetical protein KDD44_07425, partial [Bdellovibrionales bacterium]|nr:hypothetical protein [Bdellovibrionales bacterium]
MRLISPRGRSLFRGSLLFAPLTLLFLAACSVTPHRGRPAGDRPAQKQQTSQSETGKRRNDQPETEVRQPAFQKGEASYYGEEFAGQRTASSERYDPSEFTAAHRSLPFGTRVAVHNLENGKTTEVRIN